MLMPEHHVRNWPCHWWLNTAGMEKLPSFEADLKRAFTPCAGSKFFFLNQKSKFLASRKPELSSTVPTTAFPPSSKYGKLHNQQFWGLWAALDERGHRDSRQRKPCSMTWMGILGTTQPQAHSSSATHNRTPRASLLHCICHPPITSNKCREQIQERTEARPHSQLLWTGAAPGLWLQLQLKANAVSNMSVL